jgi:hypothetical protein
LCFLLWENDVHCAEKNKEMIDVFAAHSEEKKHPEVSKQAG